MFRDIFIKKVFIIFIVTRVIVFVGGEIASQLFPSYTYEGNNFSVYQIQEYKGNSTYFLNVRSSLNLRDFLNLDEFLQFDANYYEKLVTYGYDKYQLKSQHPAANWPFLPLYPATVSTLFIFTKAVFSANTTGIIVSNIFLYLGFLYLFRFVTDRFNEDIAEKTIWMIAIFPTTYFLSSFYTESLYLFIISFSLYVLNKKRWLTAALILSLGSITRITAIFLPAVYIWEIFKENEYNIYKTLKSKPLYYSLLMPIPLFIYLIYIKNITGSFFAPFSEQANWGREVNLSPLFSIIEYFKSPYFHIPWDLGMVTISLVVLSLIATFFVFKKIGFGIGVFTLLSILLPLLSGFAGMSRFLLSATPIFIIFGIWAERSKAAYYVLTSSFLFLFSIYLACYVNGYFFTM